ncbi:MAG: hypothetical protein ACOYLX_21860, partial [Burkholderiaceae bacterium]
RGATVTLTVTYPAVLTGYSARMIGRATYDTASTRFSLVSPTTITISLGATATTAVATLSSSVTGALTMGETGVFDFEFFDGSSPSIVKECLKKGTFEVIPNSNAAP